MYTKAIRSHVGERGGHENCRLSIQNVKSGPQRKLKFRNIFEFEKTKTT
jgi:hypothetical protein